jgi:hypothetical protein
MKLSKLAFAALLLIACVPLSLGQGTYTQIDVPGSTLIAIDGCSADISSWD